MANGIEPIWMAVVEVSGAKIAGTLVAETGQHVTSAQSLGEVATGPFSPQFMSMGMAAAAMLLAWLQQSIMRWLPQALWLQALSVSAG